MLVAIPGWAFPFLPRQLTLAAFLTIGIPSFVLALAPSDGPLYRGRLLRALAAFAVPAGLAIAAASLASFFLVDTVFGGSLEAGRTAATTTLVVLGLCFILLLERGPGREDIAIQSYMLALVAALGALYALALAVPAAREFFDLTPMGGGQLFLALLSAAAGLVLASVVWRIPIDRAARGAPSATRRGADRSGDGAAEDRAGQTANPAVGAVLMASSGTRRVAPDGAPRILPAAPRSSRPSGRRAGTRRFFVSSSRPGSTSSGSTSPTARPTSTPRRCAASGRSARRSAGRSGSWATCLGPSSASASSRGTSPSCTPARPCGCEVRPTGPPATTSCSRCSGTASRRRSHEGDPVFLADGRVRLRVVSVSGDDVICEIEAGGAVSSHQGVNLPGADADLPETGVSDEPWIDFACENGIDLLAVSFVRRPSDLEKVEARVKERGLDIPLIAKIEKPQAAERAPGDHRGGGQRHHGRPRRPRASSCRSRRCPERRSG